MSKMSIIYALRSDSSILKKWQALLRKSKFIHKKPNENCTPHSLFSFVIKTFFSEKKTVFRNIGFVTGKNRCVETEKTSYVMGKTSFKIFKNRF